MQYTIRALESTETDILEDFLYEAIFIPEGTAAPPKDIIKQPELQVYLTDFGKQKGDFAYVAETAQQIVGAVWVRIMDDYGHIDDDTPSLAISLYGAYRNRGIGTALMKTMLQKLRQERYQQVSLSVQKANYAVNLYKKVGFTIVAEHADEYIMLCKLQTTDRA